MPTDHRPLPPDRLSPEDRAALLAALDQAAIVAVTDRRGRIRYANRNFAAISGFAEEELLGQDHALLNSGLHPTAFWRDMYRTVAGGGVWRGRIRNRTRSLRHYWVDTTICGCFDEAGRLDRMVAIRFDVTAEEEAKARLRRIRDSLAASVREHAELSERLAASHEQLAARNRELAEALAIARQGMQARTAFLANMGHEIRTPLTAILGFADLLAEEDGDPSKRQQAVERIRRNGRHLLRLLNDVLEVARAGSGHLVLEECMIDPRELVHDVADMLQVEAATRGLDLRASVDDEVPDMIRADPTRLRQILLNLVGNAVKFTEEGSVDLGLSVDGDQLVWEVADTGVGVDPDALERLFEPFEQADASVTRRYGGSGLGLAISRLLATAMDGTLEGAPRPEGGSTFTLRLPRRTADPALPPAGPEADGPIDDGGTSNALAGRRVLVVEDSPDVARLITHFLRREGAEVDLVEDGRAALDRLVGGEAVHEAVVLDLQLPVLDGLEVARRVRERGIGLPIVAISAHATDEQARRCLAADCTAFVAKPFTGTELVGAVAGALSARRAA